MKIQLITCLLSALVVSSSSVAVTASHKQTSYRATQVNLQSITPEEELMRLKSGNERFMNNKPIQHDFLHQAKLSSLKGQFPAAIILSCMDSRTSPEIILDQGLGEIFSIRVAGNITDVDQIASMEYATKVVGTKLIVVMGHTQCGAVKGACENVQLGNLSQLLRKIQPAITQVKEASHAFDCKSNETVDKIAKQNVLDMMQQITEQSPIIRDLVHSKRVRIVGAMHNLRNGKVVFFDERGENK